MSARTFEDVLADALKEYATMHMRITQAVERFCRYHELDDAALKTIRSIVTAAESLGQQAGYAQGMSDGRTIAQTLFPSTPGARHNGHTDSSSAHDVVNGASDDATGGGDGHAGADGAVGSASPQPASDPT